jgi:fumarylacetoacetase
MDPTCNPKLRSFLTIAPESHFSIQNLPLGVFRKSPRDEPHIGVAIGDWILDLFVLAKERLLNGLSFAGDFFLFQHDLSAFLAHGRPAWRQLRDRLSRLLRHDDGTLRDNVALRNRALLEREAVQMLLPIRIENYTDFYSSREHASNVGSMFRGAQNALMPNWLHLPIAYHGRASSIVVSGTAIRRPQGQTMADDATVPAFGPTKSLDFELELGFVVGAGNKLGEPVPIAEADQHLAAVTLVNDWSARDVQRWEYQPLGPFLAKNFSTSMSPWLVSLDALEPFRVPGPVQLPPPLPYLQGEGNGNFDIQLEVLLQTARMDRPVRISATNARYLYWNSRQQLAHHTSNGCNLRPGDLLATGTISGPTPDSCGSMLELAWKGTRPIELPTGEKRSFLQDGDRLTLTGWCQGDGYRVGLSEVTGQIVG